MCSSTSTVRCFSFFFNDTATTEIYTLSLHDALPISPDLEAAALARGYFGIDVPFMSHIGLEPVSLAPGLARTRLPRSEEHTSELQSRPHLVCRLLLEKKNPGASR